MKRFTKLVQWSGSAALAAAFCVSPASAQESNSTLTEPVYRLSKNDSAVDSGVRPHPLDPALQLARKGMLTVRQQIDDYTATIVKRERVNGTLGEHEFMFCKIRNRKDEPGKAQVPFSVYLAFLKPSSVRGREVIYVENQNNGNITAHEGGIKGRFLPTVNLNPTSALAMRGQLYPITDIGIENLISKLIEKGERDKQHGLCDVQFLNGAKVDGRACTVLQVTHTDRKPAFDFHIAQVFIDSEFEIPIRYAAYGWPDQPGGEPIVLEEYTYQNLKFNVGLTDADFDSKNPNYNFGR